MKKGFTLIELLGVLILLAVIALITFPIIDKVLSNAKNEAYERQKDSIIEAARLYVTTNGNYSTNQTQLSFQTLIDSGYLKEGEILDPRDSSKEMPGCVIYNWDESKNQYMFEYSEDCVVATPAECFTYQDYEDGIEITDYDNTCGGFDVVIPDTIDGKKVLSIGGFSFNDKKLTSVIIPNSVKIIELAAFAYNQLTNVTIPNSVITIGESAFSQNQLTSVTIPNSVKIIETGAFSQNKLTKLNLSNLINITSIDEDAFWCNPILSENFIGINQYTYEYFRFDCLPR